MLLAAVGQPEVMQISLKLSFFLNVAGRSETGKHNALASIWGDAAGYRTHNRTLEIKLAARGGQSG